MHAERPWAFNARAIPIADNARVRSTAVKELDEPVESAKVFPFPVKKSDRMDEVKMEKKREKKIDELNRHACP